MLKTNATRYSKILLGLIGLYSIEANPSNATQMTSQSSSLSQKQKIFTQKMQAIINKQFGPTLDILKAEDSKLNIILAEGRTFVGSIGPNNASKNINLILNPDYTNFIVRDTNGNEGLYILNSESFNLLHSDSTTLGKLTDIIRNIKTNKTLEFRAGKDFLSDLFSKKASQKKVKNNNSQQTSNSSSNHLDKVQAIMQERLNSDQNGYFIDQAGIILSEYGFYNLLEDHSQKANIDAFKNFRNVIYKMLRNTYKKSVSKYLKAKNAYIELVLDGNHIVPHVVGSKKAKNKIVMSFDSALFTISVKDSAGQTGEYLSYDLFTLLSPLADNKTQSRKETKVPKSNTFEYGSGSNILKTIFSK